MKVEKTSNLKYIEECIEEVKSDINVEKNLDAVQRTLNREFTSTFCTDIIIVDTIRTDKFFGMRVYPDKESTERISEYIMTSIRQLDKKQTKERISSELRHTKTGYIVEIDSRLLTDKAINPTPAELTAMLLHEVGHVETMFDSIIKRLIYTFTLAAMKYGSAVPIILSIPKFGLGIPLLSLFIINGFTNVGFNMVSQKIEMESDKFVVEHGYGEDLNNIIAKMLKAGLNSSQVNKSSKDVYDDNNIFAHWTLQNIVNYESRRRAIIQELEVQYNMETSNYIKLIIQGIMANMRNILRVKQEHFNESVTKISIDMLNEGFFQDVLNRPKVRQRDIDEIKVDIECMQDYDDKMVIINKIHKRLSQVHDTLLKAKDPLDTQVFTSYQKELTELLNKALSTKVVEKQFGVFIKYPEGYEG